MCVCVCDTHCGQTPAPQASCLTDESVTSSQGVFEKVFCVPLFHHRKHPVQCLPPHTKKKIKPVVTSAQWMDQATIPSTINPKLRQGRERRETNLWKKKIESKDKKKRITLAVWQETSISSPSFSKKKKSKLFSSRFHMISFIWGATPAISHRRHGLSGQIRRLGLYLDSHRTVSILWRLKSHTSSHLLRVQRQLKRGASQTWHSSHFKESLLRTNKTSPDKPKQPKTRVNSIKQWGEFHPERETPPTPLEQKILERKRLFGLDSVVGSVTLAKKLSLSYMWFVVNEMSKGQPIQSCPGLMLYCIQ